MKERPQGVSKRAVYILYIPYMRVLRPLNANFASIFLFCKTKLQYMKNIRSIYQRKFIAAVITAMFIPSVLHADYTEFKFNGVSYQITDPAQRRVRTSCGILYDGKYLPGSFVSGDLNLTGIVSYNGSFYTLDEIAHDSFCNNEALTRVNINVEQLKEIGLNAFEDCPVLRKVKIQTSTDYVLGAQAFYNCSNLREAELGYNVTSIGTCAFWSCEKLENFYIPSKVTFLGEYAFTYCYSLKSLIFATTKLAEIRREAFLGCKNLQTLILPERGLEKIGEYAFSNCASLEHLEIPNSVKQIDQYAFLDCGAMASLTLGNAVEIIGQGAFNGCKSLKSLTLGNAVRTIGQGAFSGCESLESLDFGPNIQTIDDMAFSICNNLKTVDLPASLLKVGKLAFNGSGAMDRVVCRATTPPEAGDIMFSEDTYQQATLYVPAASVSSYASHPEWGKFNRIADINSMNSGIEAVESDYRINDEIFNLDGTRMDEGIAPSKPGIYILRSGSETRKILIR